ncbi:AmmeMemoRadiSam system protein B [uncultured Vibrio sp.]|uniref:AmmeMemoRadiSam system protein B n=1 Tax=uncultured Vibrio sp. TaxID=114054 RepID=UPI002AA8D6DE|nr:AmmeMemoRadiSam system protein B [uncultured Vibrio sp.]
MTRMPAVAGRFYPGHPMDLRRSVAELIPQVPETALQVAHAVVMPHAGYVYSGATAGATIARVRVPETVLIMGPNHHGRGQVLALGREDWQMPMGKVAIDQQLAEAIVQSSALIKVDEEAHLSEHSLEVQVPFLQQVQPALKIVPLVVSTLSYAACELVARELAVAIGSLRRPVLILASTDMSHYESRQAASRKDGMAIERILAMDPQGLYSTVMGQRISMCGIMPTTIALLTARELGATRAELVQYTDSGKTSGDASQVVGYAGLIIS